MKKEFRKKNPNQKAKRNSNNLKTMQNESGDTSFVLMQVAKRGWFSLSS
jgi:hypothetical protein